MKSREITIIKNGVRETALIEYEGGKPSLHILFNDGMRKTYTALDLYDSFGLLRADLNDIVFYAKAQKSTFIPQECLHTCQMG